MQLISKLATTVGVVAVAATLAVPAPSAGSQNGQAHRGDPSVRLFASGGPETHRAGGGLALRLMMDGKSPAENKPLDKLTNTGSAALTAVVVRRGEGEAVRVPGRYDGWAAQLPAYEDSSAPPRAAIRVTNTGSKGDALSPGRHSFRFGAEFRLDDASEGSQVDNGDNLVQRGLYQSRRQYKLQVDHRVVLCRVKGAQGTLVARSSTIAPQTWYRVLCRRNEGKVVLKVWQLAADGPALLSKTSTQGATGSLTMARRTPLSVGGKLSQKGKIPAGGSDQFNGVVDRVVYAVAK
jgi:hypothetical protein